MKTCICPTGSSAHFKEAHTGRKGIAPYGIAFESWYPLGHGDFTLLTESPFSELAAEYGKTNAQIVLRWHIQEANIIFPRSVSPQHIRENLNIFDFSLTNAQMAQIRRLDKGHRFFRMSFAEQEEKLGQFVPAD